MQRGLIGWGNRTLKEKRDEVLEDVDEYLQKESKVMKAILNDVCSQLNILTAYDQQHQDLKKRWNAQRLVTHKHIWKK